MDIAQGRSTTPIKVGLVQINNSFSGQNYLPYSVGILAAYAKKYAKNPDAFDFLNPVYLRGPVPEAIQKLAGAQMIFFSAYVWNIRISLEIARTIKQTHPETIIAFGGPQVPDRIEEFIRKNSFIDVACHGEGEQTFLNLLEAGVERGQHKDWSDIPSISYIDKKGVLNQNPRGERIKNIADVPSPYLSGIFKPLMDANPQEKWIVLWETNRGCPFQCTFCDWGSATASRVFQFDLDRLVKEVDWFANHQIEFVFCADANFGMLERDYDIAAYVAESKKKRGYPHALSVQNTKNATERAYRVQKLLSDSQLNKGVTIALQSLDPMTLKNIKRSNISTDSYQELQRRFTKDRVETYTDIIVGLPGETYESFKEGVCLVIENGQHNRIQFNNLSILPNAEMGDPEYQKKHGMIIVETNVVNIHGSLATSNNEIFETQHLVVGHATTPKEDWIKTRSYGWMVALLYFDKILQIPLLLLHTYYGAKFADLFSIFIDGTLDQYPILKGIRSFFHDKALDIQNGGAEYCPSEKWLNIWWPADELVLINLCTNNQLEAFYKETHSAISAFIDSTGIDVPRELLDEAFDFNKSLVKLPFQTTDLEKEYTYALWEAYQAALVGEGTSIEQKRSRYRIDRTSKMWTTWEDWCREVIWWGNKKGAYLYSNTAVEPQLSGHF